MKTLYRPEQTSATAVTAAQLSPLVDHLTRTTQLPPAQARRVIDDVLSYFNETVETYAKRRHAEMQSRGMRNSAIFEQLSDEIEAHRFLSASLSARQIRRLIYG